MTLANLRSPAVGTAAGVVLGYAIDAVAAVAAGDDGWDLWRPMLVVAAFTAGALVLASLTLRRRTP